MNTRVNTPVANASASRASVLNNQPVNTKKVASAANPPKTAQVKKTVQRDINSLIAQDAKAFNTLLERKFGYFGGAEFKGIDISAKQQKVVFQLGVDINPIKKRLSETAQQKLFEQYSQNPKNEKPLIPVIGQLMKDIAYVQTMTGNMEKLVNAFDDQEVSSSLAIKNDGSALYLLINKEDFERVSPAIKGNFPDKTTNDKKLLASIDWNKMSSDYLKNNLNLSNDAKAKLTQVFGKAGAQHYADALYALLSGKYRIV
jgi:hypothetical protein